MVLILVLTIFVYREIKKRTHQMARQHKLYFVLRKYKPIDQKQAILIKYRGPSATQKSIGLQILPSHWDQQKHWIKDKYLGNHKNLLAKLKEYRDKMDDALVDLQSGVISRDTAFERILSKPHDKTTLYEFIMNDWNTISETQKRKYLTFSKAIKTNLSNANYSDPELPISLLSNVDECKKISVIIKKTSKGNDYFDMLDRVSRAAPLPIKNVFKDEGLKNKGVKRRRKQKKQVEFFDEWKFKLEGYNKINTPLQLQSYLWFLYSFCLQGMDGADIVSLGESDFINYQGRKKTINHFHPEGNSIQSKGDFSQKQYVILRRQKSEGVVAALYNVFPILFIRDWLHYLIGVTHPQYQYKGNDRIRLFSFDTLDSDGNPDPKVMDGPWKQMRDDYRKYQKKLFGASTKKARHAFTAICYNDLGMSKLDIQMMLGHDVGKEAIAAYLPTTPEMVTRDIQQMQVLEKFGVIELLWEMYDRFSKEEYRGIPMIKTTPDMFVGLRLLEGGKGKLLSWSPEKEWEYQRQLNQVITGSSEIYFDEILGKKQKRLKPVEREDWPQELKELYLERDKASLRWPEGLKKTPLTKEIIDHNKKMAKELKELGANVNIE